MEKKAPNLNSSFRPKRSPNAPKYNTEQARPKVNALATAVSCAWVAPNSRLMLGNATLAIPKFMFAAIAPRINAASTSALRGGFVPNEGANVADIFWSMPPRATSAVIRYVDLCQSLSPCVCTLVISSLHADVDDVTNCLLFASFSIWQKEAVGPHQITGLQMDQAHVGSADIRLVRVTAR